MDKPLGQFLYFLVKERFLGRTFPLTCDLRWHVIRSEIQEIWNDIAKQLVLEYDRRCKEAEDNNEIPIIVMRPDNAEAKTYRQIVEIEADPPDCQDYR